MKKGLVILLLSILVAVSCNETFWPSYPAPVLSPKYLESSVNSMEIGFMGEAKSFDVISIATPWRIENSTEWLSFSPNSLSSSELDGFQIIDKSVSVSAQENVIASVARTAVAYLRSSPETQDYTFEKPLAITQEGATPYINLSGNTIKFSARAYSQVVSIKTNCLDLRLSTDKEWINASLNDNDITISVDYNTSSSSRSGIVTITAYNDGATVCTNRIHINQDVANITASSSGIEFECSASAVKLEINSETPWTASTSSSWIEISPKSGSEGKSELIITVSPNNTINYRTGTVYLLVGSSQRVRIPIKQQGLYIKSDVTSLSFVAKGETKQVSISSNTLWDVLSKPEWISLSENEGTGSATLQVSAADNPFTYSRNGKIVIGFEGMNLSVEISVNQVGKYFGANTTLLNFSDKAGTQTIEIKTDGSWSASSEDTWISLNPKSAVGDNNLSVTVTENTSSEERTGSLKLVMGDKVVPVEVIQQGKYFSIDNDKLTYPSKGGTINLSVSTNDSWTAKIEGEVSWLALSATQATGNANINITASDNATLNSRSATVVLETANHQSIKLKVTQEPRYLKLSSQSILFYAKGGTSELVTIDTDAKYSITQDGAWFSISQNGDSFTVTAKENTGEDPRYGKIKISMTDLVAGSYLLELEVVQLTEGSAFFLNGFENLEDWSNDGHFTNIKMNLSPYNEDKDWSNDSGDVDVYINPFEKDNDWNGAATGEFDRDGYSSDSNHDRDTASVNVNINPYDKNEDWDGDSEGSFGRDDYGKDEDWDGDSEGDFGRGEYGDDRDYDKEIKKDNINIKIIFVSNDENWDSSLSYKFTINKTGYDNDEDWSDKRDEGKGDVQNSGYGDDNNWNPKK